MNKIIIAGYLKGSSNTWKHPQRTIVYDTKGICACLNGMDGRANHPKIIEYETEDTTSNE